MATLSAKTRLFLFQELIVADHGLCLLQHWQVVPAVVDQGHKGLVNDLVVVGEYVGRQEISLPNLNPVYAQLFSRDVHQPLYYIYALRPSGPPQG